MEVKNGLYSTSIEIRDGKRGHATGVIVLCDGRILGGDTYFYYTGSYSFKNGMWRGELTTRQHTEAVGVNLAFGGREVTCGFTGHYSDDGAEVDGTALVGKTSVMFHAFENAVAILKVTTLVGVCSLLPWNAFVTLLMSSFAKSIAPSGNVRTARVPTSKELTAVCLRT
jgi:hypothetical protein